MSQENEPDAKALFKRAVIETMAQSVATPEPTTEEWVRFCNRMFSAVGMVAGSFGIIPDVFCQKVWMVNKALAMKEGEVEAGIDMAAASRVSAQIIDSVGGFDKVMEDLEKTDDEDIDG